MPAEGSARSAGPDGDGVALRPVTAADDAFLFAVYASTRAEELAGTGWSAAQRKIFLQSQFELRRAHYARVFPAARRWLVLRHGNPIGTLQVDRTAEEIRVVDIAFLPAHRGRGLGSRLLRGLCEEARAADKPLRLHVLKADRAAHLYTRLGFAPTGENGPYLKLEWRARSDAPAADGA